MLLCEYRHHRHGAGTSHAALHIVWGSAKDHSKADTVGVKIPCFPTKMTNADELDEGDRNADGPFDLLSQVGDVLRQVNASATVVQDVCDKFLL